MQAYNHIYDETHDTEYRYNYGVGGNAGQYLRYNLSKTSITLNAMFLGSDVSANTTVSVWYR